MAVREKTPFVPNEIYFITFTINEWKKIFTSEKYFLLVFKWFDYIKSIYGNKIHGYCIMPNHIHCLIKITDKSPRLSILIMNAKRFLAYGIIGLLVDDNRIDLISHFKIDIIRKNKAKHKIFKERYDSLIIQSQKLFLEKLNYIHNNPCQEKWRLSKEPEDYKYSSASNYILGRGTYLVDLMDF